jgi:hypothetical protein
VLLVVLLAAHQMNDSIDQKRLEKLQAERDAERDRIAVEARKPKIFCSDDDGRTFFKMLADTPIPFTHNGKLAVRAHVFRCSDIGPSFVGYLEKADAVKRPGETNWVGLSDPEAARVTKIKCWNGSYASVVSPR